MFPITFYFDFLSPYSYLAHSQLETLGAPVRRVPISVLEVMKLVNNTPTTLICSVKRAYAGADLGRWAARYGTPIAFPDLEQLDGELLLRLAVAAEGIDLSAELVASIFKGVWGGSGDPSPAGVAGLLTASGLPAAALMAAAEAPEAAEALASSNRAAAALGVFGAPTFHVGDQLFFGNDRLDFVREALAAQQVGA